MNFEETVKKVLTNSLKMVKMYEWLLDLYVLDFFVDDHWSKLPKSWQKVFENMDASSLGAIISGKHTNHMLPLSFLALVRAIEAYSLSRKRLFDPESKIPISNYLGHPKLKNLFLKHVKLKKRHEISLMADIVKLTALDADCNAVVDFGSGLGHLVRMLAYKHEFHAAGIECQTQLTEEARKLDLELEYTVKKHLNADSISKLHQPTHYNITLSSINQLDELSLPETMENFGLVGLHPCGDLGPLLLKYFVNSSKVKYICVVGCCYMKLSCGGGNTGYPMSSYLAALDNGLSFVSREIACHAIEVYCERLVKGDYQDLKVHAYRAALERILVDNDPKLKHAPVRSIKHTNSLTFHRYCALATERLNITLPKCERAWAQGEDDLQKWRRVVTVYTLRLALAPLVETVVLLDRVLFVLEHVSFRVKQVTNGQTLQSYGFLV
ncbi:methyltransferase-like protein 25B isoform X2 [Plodia interpunctella]|uniref:methyltransferase-like protein 25B isoform X2 n=1 Tax=Plodia interpunctella TaxID=58824 RepID=UPI00236831A6|nr:methyltransferase-like protein 25B isoform X2 [Plodia interpunctella]